MVFVELAAATAAAVENTPKLVKPSVGKCVAGAIGMPSIGVAVGKCALSITLCWLCVKTGTGWPGDWDNNDRFDVDERSFRRNLARRFWNQTYRNEQKMY